MTLLVDSRKMVVSININSTVCKVLSANPANNKYCHPHVLKYHKDNYDGKAMEDQSFVGLIMCDVIMITTTIIC